MDPHDIPNGYCVAKHMALEDTIAKPCDLESLQSGRLKVMACHQSAVDHPIPCAGWVANQIGPGNNILLRLRVLTGDIASPITVGKQHDRFEDTLPDDGRRME